MLRVFRDREDVTILRLERLTAGTDRVDTCRTAAVLLRPLRMLCEADGDFRVTAFLVEAVREDVCLRFDVETDDDLRDAADFRAEVVIIILV